MNARHAISVADACGRVATFAACGLFGFLWLNAVCFPLLVGVPMGWETAPLLAATLPTFVVLGWGWWFAHRD